MKKEKTEAGNITGRWRKGRYAGFLAAGLFAAMLTFTGCGSAASEMAMMKTSQSADGGYESAAYDTGDVYANDYEYDTTESVAEENATQEVAVQDTSRKLIRNVTMDVETEEFETLYAKVNEKTKAYGGYVESSNVFNDSIYNGNRLRNASLTIRIPQDKLDDFLANVAEISNVTSRSENVTDVTLQYVDMESHKKALEVEQERLLDLLEQAESVEDIITIESRLSDVRYQIESMESQLRTMDNQVNYSTVYLYIDEVKKLTPVEEQDTWEKISSGFMNSLEDVGEGLSEFGVNVLIDLPYIVVFLIVLLIFILVIKGIVRGHKRRKIKREQRAEAKAARKTEKAAKKAAKKAGVQAAVVTGQGMTGNQEAVGAVDSAVQNTESTEKDEKHE